MGGDQAEQAVALSHAAHLVALQVIRRALQEASADARYPHKRWSATSARFREAHAQMLWHQNGGLVVAAWNNPSLTRHEKRLIRATAAAQANDAGLVDNLIFKLAPGQLVRPWLAGAITSLASSLQAVGYHLALPSLPAAALTVARLRDTDLTGVTVSWPHAPNPEDAS